MSRAYRISVSESARRHIEVEDGLKTRLDVLGVLPAEEMSEILAAQLAERGFERDGDVMTRTDEDGVVVTVDVKDGTLTVKLASDREVTVSVERSSRVYEERMDEGRARLKKAVERELEARVDDERAKLTAEVTEVLEKKLRDLRAEMDRVTNRTTAEALKRRASQLGEVKEISEDEETGAITIKVKV